MNKTTQIPDDAITIQASGEPSCLSVWLTEKSLKMHLHQGNFCVALDIRALPDLVDALIELQNKPTRSLFDELKEGIDHLSTMRESKTTQETT